MDVVLSPDPNVFRHSDPLAGLAVGGAFVIQSEATPESFARTIPLAARRALRDRNIRVYLLDGFAIAGAEASDIDLRYRMQGAAFMGAFFAVSPLAAANGLDEARLFVGIQQQMEKKFNKLGKRVVDDNVRVIERGYRELKHVDVSTLSMESDEEVSVPSIPDMLDEPGAIL